MDHQPKIENIEGKKYEEYEHDNNNKEYIYYE